MKPPAPASVLPPAVASISTVRNFWPKPGRPAIYTDSLLEVVVPVPKDWTLDQAEPALSSNRLWLRYGVPASRASEHAPLVKGDPSAGNLRLFQPKDKHATTLSEQPTGLEEVCVLDMVPRPGEHPFGDQLLLTDRHNTVLWSVDRKRIIAVVPIHQPATRTAFSPDGKHLVTAFDNGKLRVFEVVDTRTKPVPDYTVNFNELTGQQLTVGDGGPTRDWHLKFSPGSQYVHMIRYFGTTQHQRARLKMSDRMVQLYEADAADDWATTIAAGSGSSGQEVAFAGLNEFCHHHKSGTGKVEPKLLGKRDTVCVSGLELLTQGLAVAYNSGTLWVTDLAKATRTNVTILAERAIAVGDRTRLRYHRMGTFKDNLFVIIGEKTTTDRGVRLPTRKLVLKDG